MFRGYRHIIVAALGWLTLASPPSYAAEGDQAAREKQSRDDIKRPTVAFEKLPKASQPDPGCKEGEDNRYSDLCAQWKAADAAKKSADWTKRTFWLGVIGAFIGFLTLAAAAFAAWWARRAAEHTETGAVEAKRSADSAIQSNESARAWVSQNGMQRCSFTNGTFNKVSIIEGYGFQLQWSNIGQSPSINLRICQIFELIENDAELPFFEIPFPESIQSTTLVQGGSLASEWLILNDIQWAAFKAGERDLVIYSQVEYFDIFGDPTVESDKHISEICWHGRHHGGRMQRGDDLLDSIFFYPEGRQNRLT